MELEIQRLKDQNLALKQRLKTKNGAAVARSTVDEEKLKEALAEIERLKELLRKKEDRIQQMEQDLSSKDEIISEMNGAFSVKMEQKQSELDARDNTIEELQNRIRSNEAEMQRLTKQLEDGMNPLNL